MDFARRGSMGYGLLVPYRLGYAFPRPPSLWTDWDITGYGFTGMGYIDCRCKYSFVHHD